MFNRKPHTPLSLVQSSPVAELNLNTNREGPITKGDYDWPAEPDPVNDMLEAGLAEITQQRQHFDNMPVSQRHAELTAQMIGAFEAKEAELDAERQRVEFELLETRKTLAAYRHANRMLTANEEPINAAIPTE